MGDKIVRKINADVLGVGASVICAVHCAIWPLLLMLLPIAGSNLNEHENLEYFLLSFSFLIGIWSLGRGYFFRHKRLGPLLLFFISFLLLLLAHWYVDHEWEFLLIILAASGIIIAHLLNLKWSKSHCV
jgi:hypothetical protein